MQKPTKKSRNNAFLAEKRLTAALGTGCRRFEPGHPDHTECSYSNREVFCKNTLFRFHILTNCFYTAVVAGVAAGT